MTGRATHKQPIVYHGAAYKDQGLYTAMPVALARDRGLSGAGARVALWLWSQSSGWQISERAIADATGLNRRTVGNGLSNLQDTRWLVLADCRMHLQRKRPFTDAEVEQIVSGVLSGAESAPHSGAKSAPLRSATRSANRKTSSAPLTIAAQEWKPNRTHRASAQRLGLDCEVQADRFQEHIAGSSRPDMDRAFGGFLIDAAAQEV
ncbi:hypothetical protein ACPXB3_00360 [Gordonia sp. DT219]|uniref:hypothetical protein n=1 Tax=Gordonia sp. DT219 TaxID=3416658 RepID=UPI003CEBB129